MDKKIIFISYGGNIDQEIAKLLCNYLINSTGNKDMVFCSAIQDNNIGTPYGEDFVNAYSDSLANAKIFIPLISENYFDSKTAMIELGAAFILKKTMIPFLVSGCNYEKIIPLFNLRNRDLYQIDNKDAFEKAINRISEKLSEEKITFTINSSSQEEIIDNIRKLKTNEKTEIKNTKEVFFESTILFNDTPKYNNFIKVLGDFKIVEICISKINNNKLVECRLYLKKSKKIDDVITVLKDIGISDYKFKNIGV